MRDADSSRGQELKLEQVEGERSRAERHEGRRVVGAVAGSRQDPSRNGIALQLTRMMMSDVPGSTCIPAISCGVRTSRRTNRTMVEPKHLARDAKAGIRLRQRSG